MMEQMTGKSNGFVRVLLAIGLVLLILAAVITSIEYCAKDSGWLMKEYERLDINDYTGMSNEDMTLAFMTMVDFVTSKSDSMSVKVNCFGEEVDMYNETEVAHLYDVRNLYTGVMWARACCISVAIIGIAVFMIVEKHDRFRHLSKTYLICFAAVTGFFVLLAAWALVDFRSFWYVFHAVFLNIEGSTFDPDVSRMTRICPERLFLDMCMRICAIAFGICLIAAAAAIVYLCVCSKDKKVYYK